MSRLTRGLLVSIAASSAVAAQLMTDLDHRFWGMAGSTTDFPASTPFSDA